jgi:hypothetical protein
MAYSPFFHARGCVVEAVILGTTHGIETILCVEIAYDKAIVIGSSLGGIEAHEEM